MEVVSCGERFKLGGWDLRLERLDRGFTGGPWARAPDEGREEDQSVRPQMKELVREASRALAILDAERLEELALSCQALNRDRLGTDISRARQFGRDVLEARQDMIVLERVLKATRANMEVMRRLQEIRGGEPEYGPGVCGPWTLTETGRGDD